MKPPKPILIDAYVEGGILCLPTNMSKQMRSALVHWPDGPVEVEVRAHLETRRARANRYYWGVVLKMMAEEMGQAPEDVHEIMKLRHNSKSIDAVQFAGTASVIPQSTAKLDISQFATYLERVMLDGNEYLGLVFPPPRGSEEWRAAKTRTA